MNIQTGFPTPQKDYYKVYVHSITYNQASYIEDCLNGVAMQQTEFPFVHHVIDDCSTDGEQKVIKAWIERECDLETAEYYDNDLCTITLAKHNINPNYTIAAYFLKKNMYGKPKKRELFKPWENVCPYIAFCEGDDYWVNKNKLQEQVLTLANNPSATMCHTSFLCVDQNRNCIFRPRYEEYKKRSRTGDCLSELLIHGNYPMTLTCMISKKVISSELYAKCPYRYDYALFLCAAMLGDFVYIDKEFSCYRYVESGAMANGTITKLSMPLRVYCLGLISKSAIVKPISIFRRIIIYSHFLNMRFVCDKSKKSKDLYEFFRYRPWLYMLVFVVPYIKIHDFLCRKKINPDILDE